jgi:CTP:molybdopterin cytidylyltransferase MocA
VIAAIILAAGDSSRMGAPKALLPDRDGLPFVVRLVRTFISAGIPDVIVVTGARHDDIVRVLDSAEVRPRARVVQNPAPGRGQLSSLWTGLAAANERPEVEAVLMTLVDVPMVSDGTVRAVVEAWRRTGAPIVRPAIGDRHGHPVLFDRAVFDELRRAPLAEGAKTVVHAHAGDALDVAVDDEGCLADVDTPADYERLTGRTVQRPARP